MVEQGIDVTRRGLPHVSNAERPSFQGTIAIRDGHPFLSKECIERGDIKRAGVGHCGNGLGAVAFGQPDLGRLVENSVQLYLERRDEIDPDGALLQEMLRSWVAVRLEYDSFRTQAAVAIFLAARGDRRGAERRATV